MPRYAVSWTVGPGNTEANAAYAPVFRANDINAPVGGPTIGKAYIFVVGVTPLGSPVNIEVWVQRSTDTLPDGFRQFVAGGVYDGDVIQVANLSGNTVHGVALVERP